MQTPFATAQRDHFAVTEIERDFGGFHEDLAFGLKIPGLAGGNLPDFLAVAHLHPTEVLHTLVHFGGYIFPYFIDQSCVMVLSAPGDIQIVYDPGYQQQRNHSRNKAYLITTHAVPTCPSKIPPLRGRSKDRSVKKYAKGQRVNRAGRRAVRRSAAALSPRRQARAGRAAGTQAG